MASLQNVPVLPTWMSRFRRHRILDYTPQDQPRACLTPAFRQYHFGRGACVPHHGMGQHRQPARMLGALLDDQRHASADALSSPDRGCRSRRRGAADSVRTNRASRATARAASWHRRRVASASGSRISLYRVRQSVTPSLPTQTRRALGLSQNLGAAAAHGSYRLELRRREETSGRAETRTGLSKSHRLSLPAAPCVRTHDHQSWPHREPAGRLGNSRSRASLVLVPLVVIALVVVTVVGPLAPVFAIVASVGRRSQAHRQHTRHSGRSRTGSEWRRLVSIWKPPEYWLPGSAAGVKWGAPGQRTVCERIGPRLEQPAPDRPSGFERPRSVHFRDCAGTGSFLGLDRRRGSGRRTSEFAGWCVPAQSSHVTSPVVTS